MIDSASNHRINQSHGVFATSNTHVKLNEIECNIFLSASQRKTLFESSDPRCRIVTANYVCCSNTGVGPRGGWIQLCCVLEQTSRFRHICLGDCAGSFRTLLQLFKKRASVGEINRRVVRAE